MHEPSLVYVGIDTAKAKLAVALAQGGRNGDLRYLGEIEATPAAVEQLVQIVFGEGKMVEWFEYDDAPGPGYFKIVTSNPAATNEQAARFIRAMDSVKRKSAWLHKVELTQVEQMNMYVGAILHTGGKITLRQVT